MVTFLVTLSQEWSNFSAHYGVCVLAWLFVCLWTAEYPHSRISSLSIWPENAVSICASHSSCLHCTLHPSSFVSTLSSTSSSLFTYCMGICIVQAITPYYMKAMSYGAVGCIGRIVRMVSRDHDFIYCPHIMGHGVENDNADENCTVRISSHFKLPWGVARN